MDRLNNFARGCCRRAPAAPCADSDQKIYLYDREEHLRVQAHNLAIERRDYRIPRSPKEALARLLEDADQARRPQRHDSPPGARARHHEAPYRAAGSPAAAWPAPEFMAGQDSRPLSATALVQLHGHDAQQLARATTAQMPTLVHALWNALERNTAALQAKWHYAGTSPSDAPDAVLARFPGAVDPNGVRFGQVGLVRDGAIADPVRCSQGGAPCYLHANAVDLHCGRAFIASQRPTPGEIPGFLQHLLHVKIPLVVDLTGTAEFPGEGDYTPHTAGAVLNASHHLGVTCEAASHVSALMATHERLVVSDALGAHGFDRLHFTGWPDHGAPDPATLTALADKVESLATDPSRPILVHCRAGVGRTGTLMSFIAARRRITEMVQANGGRCDVATILRVLMDVVADGRINRGPMFVQTEAQFNAVAQALLRQFARPGRSRTPANPVPPAAGLPAYRGPDARPGSGTRAGPSGQPRDTGARSLNHVRTAMLWNRLGQAARSGNDMPVLPNSEVGGNYRGVDCLRASAVSVATGPRENTRYQYLHANTISVGRDAAAAGSNRIAIAGQSPQSPGLTERFLLQGIDSNRGLFQFVAGSNQGSAREQTIVGQLQQQMAASMQAGTPLRLGDRYTVAALTQLKPEQGACRRFMLTVNDLHHLPHTRSVVLTEAGLPFENHLLRASDIERASLLMDSHVQAGSPGDRAAQADPMAISYGGVGRNAALITYREVLARAATLRSESDLDVALEQIIAQGRRDRGPYFLHSEAQLGELRRALIRTLKIPAEMAG